jgi:methylmalonyl-CoA/ethylmalonyl-CoA epimerase
VKSQIDHVGVMVEDLDESVRFLENAFGLAVSTSSSVEPSDGSMRARFLQWGPVSIELVELAAGPLREERLGSAQARIDHIALAVEDIDKALPELRDAGMQTTTDEPWELGGRRIAFVRPESAGGVIYQLIESESEPAAHDALASPEEGPTA